MSAVLPVHGPSHLAADRVDRFAADGFLCPLPALSDEELAQARAGYDALLERHSGQLPPHYKHKLHLVEPWADRLVHHPTIVGAVSEILGPDLLCWTSNLLVKKPHAPAFVSWHQDSSYWGLDPHEVVTAWLALSPASEAAGCMKVVPGSHRTGQVEHVDTFAANNMLTRGQEALLDIDRRATATMALEAGELSLHDIRLVHGSGPNTTAEPRIGLAIRYMSARVCKAGRPESAILVSGRDGGHFLAESRPGGQLLTSDRLRHNRAVRRQLTNNYRPKPGSSLRVRARLALRRSLLGGGLDLLWMGLALRRLLGSR